MPRKGPISKREILPDPIYNSRLVARFVNRLMYDGKKGPAETIFYRSLEILGEKTGEEALHAFEKAVENVKPHVEVKSRQLSCARRSASRTSGLPGSPLAHHLFPRPWRKGHDQQALR